MFCIIKLRHKKFLACLKEKGTLSDIFPKPYRAYVEWIQSIIGNMNDKQKQ